MKFIHIADLHLGKRYNELSLIEDQKYILNEIIKVCEREQADGVIIAGDVYDKSVPTIDAVELLDRFLNALSNLKKRVFIISGNHDSAERLAFASQLLAPCGVHTSPVYENNVQPIICRDDFGEVAIYLLPFIKPAAVKRFFPDRKIENYTQALAAVIGAMNIDCSRRNVLVSHQFVTGSTRSGSEELCIGDLGNVDASVFKDFDYVALGHIHRAQQVSKNARYCGTPLKYSLSEANDEKSVTIVTLNQKGSVKVEERPLVPERNLVEIKGTYEQLTNKSYYEGTTLKRDLVHVVLTDEQDVPDALAKLRIIYPNVLSLKYDNARTRSTAAADIGGEVTEASPDEMFAKLYQMQNGAPMDEAQSGYVNKLIEELWGEEL